MLDILFTILAIISIVINVVILLGALTIVLILVRIAYWLYTAK